MSDASVVKLIAGGTYQGEDALALEEGLSSEQYRSSSEYRQAMKARLMQEYEHEQELRAKAHGEDALP